MFQRKDFLAQQIDSKTKRHLLEIQTWAIDIAYAIDDLVDGNNGHAALIEMFSRYGIQKISNKPDRTPIEDLDFSTRTYNTLKLNRLNTVEEIVDFVDGNIVKLQRIRGIGKNGVNEIVKKLEERGFHIDVPKNHVS